MFPSKTRVGVAGVVGAGVGAGVAGVLLGVGGAGVVGGSVGTTGKKNI